MYYLLNVSERIRLPPNMFDMDLKDAVEKILRDKFEGKILSDIGIVLAIRNVKVDSTGVVIPTDGAAYYTTKFEVLSFLPKVNEVFEAEVKEIAKFGAFASIGPFQGLLHVSQIGKTAFRFDKKSGTLVNSGRKKSVKKGDVLLVKVATIALKKTPQDTKIGLTMRADGLGKKEWVESPEKEKKPKAVKKKGKGAKK